MSKFRDSSLIQIIIFVIVDCEKRTCPPGMLPHQDFIDYKCTCIVEAK